MGPVSRERPSPQQWARLELELGEENAATQVPLCADNLADLNELAARTGVQGNRYNEQHMSLVGR